MLSKRLLAVSFYVGNEVFVNEKKDLLYSLPYTFNFENVVLFPCRNTSIYLLLDYSFNNIHNF